MLTPLDPTWQLTSFTTLPHLPHQNHQARSRPHPSEMEWSGHYSQFPGGQVPASSEPFLPNAKKSKKGPSVHMGTSSPMGALGFCSPVFLHHSVHSTPRQRLLETSFARDFC